MTAETVNGIGTGTGTGTGEQERTAERLLRSTAARSYDPLVDIDWSAPLADDLWFMRPERCSLYGTDMWADLGEERRRELGKHEAASVAGLGIWLECVLMRMLAKVAYVGDPTGSRVQYALAELADECRHTTMFARMVERMGTPLYGPHPRVHRLGHALPLIAYGPVMWGAILIGEEIIDRYQREMAADEGIQPLMRMVNRIHIVEEARHISFAREELTRSMEQTSRAELPYHRLLLSHVAYIVCRSLISPRVYTSVGLDPRRARRAALANPAHRETIRFGGQKVMAFLDDAGLVGGPGMHWWRASFLVE